jgi:hypothetical protein
MKTSIFILSAVLAASTTMVNANFHLRASTPQVHDQDQDASLDRRRNKPDDPSPNGKWGFMGAAITVTHVSGDEINLDEEKVSQTFIQAYNKIHNNGYRVTTGFVEKAIVVPESDNFSSNQGLFSTVIFYEPFGYDCPNCPAEFGVGGEEDGLEAPFRPKPADDSKVHEKFESHFLETLRSSDTDAFADIQAVHIVFTYTDSTTTATTATTADDKSLTEEQPGVEKRNAKPSDIESMHGQIEISHTMADHSSGTFTDMKTLGEVYKQAFDEAYSVIGYEGTSFDLESEIDIPEDTGSDAEDEDGTPDALEYLSYYFINRYSFSFGFGCRWCPNDDDLLGSSLDLVAMQGTGVHRYFEKLFCHKMKHSGLLQFQKINHCSIDFDAAASDVSFADTAGVTSPQ